MLQTATRSIGSSWTHQHYFVAASFPLTLLASEAVSTFFFDGLRAPNVTILEQLSLIGLVLSLWIAVPRLIWWRLPNSPLAFNASDWHQAGIQIALLWLVLGATHLASLTFVLRLMHAPPGGDLGDFLHSYGEVLLVHGPIWTLAFALALVTSVFVRARVNAKKQSGNRIEVRDRGHARLLEPQMIEWARATGNYVELHFVEGQITVRSSLESLKPILAEEGFVVSKRGVMANLALIASIRPGGNGESYQLIFKSGSVAPLSRRRLRMIKDLLTERAKTRDR